MHEGLPPQLSKQYPLYGLAPHPDLGLCCVPGYACNLESRLHRLFYVHVTNWARPSGGRLPPHELGVAGSTGRSLPSFMDARKHALKSACEFEGECLDLPAAVVCNNLTCALPVPVSTWKDG